MVTSRVRLRARALAALAMLAACGEVAADDLAALNADLAGMACERGGGRSMRSGAGPALALEAGDRLVYRLERVRVPQFEPGAGPALEQLEMVVRLKEVDPAGILAGTELGSCRVVELPCRTQDCVTIAVSGGDRPYRLYEGQLDLYLRPGADEAAFTRRLAALVEAAQR